MNPFDEQNAKPATFVVGFCLIALGGEVYASPPVDFSFIISPHPKKGEIIMPFH